MRALYVCVVDDAGPFVGAGGYEVFRHGRAVKNAVDHDRPLAVGLAAELGRLVVHHERITERPHRQVEVLGEHLGVAPVGPQDTRPASPGSAPRPAAVPRCRRGPAPGRPSDAPRTRLG